MIFCVVRSKLNNINQRYLIYISHRITIMFTYMLTSSNCWNWLKTRPILRSFWITPSQAWALFLGHPPDNQAVHPLRKINWKLPYVGMAKESSGEEISATLTKLAYRKVACVKTGHSFPYDLYRLWDFSSSAFLARLGQFESSLSFLRMNSSLTIADCAFAFAFVGWDVLDEV